MIIFALIKNYSMKRRIGLKILICIFVLLVGFKWIFAGKIRIFGHIFWSYSQVIGGLITHKWGPENPNDPFDPYWGGSQPDPYPLNP